MAVSSAGVGAAPAAGDGFPKVRGLTGTGARLSARVGGAAATVGAAASGAGVAGGAAGAGGASS